MKNKILFYLLPIILTCICYVAFAQSTDSLDSLMSESEMRRTGMHKLSTTERIELKNWIDRNYVIKSKSPLSRSYRKLPTVSEIIQGGHYIKLDDDTMWQIYPADTATTQGWLTPVPIKVTFTGAKNYPYILTNTITNSEVKARKITYIPN